MKSTRSRSRVAITSVGAAVLAAALLAPPVQAAPDDIDVFELDGDVQDSAPQTLPDDWNDFYDDPDTTDDERTHHAFRTTGIVADPAPESIFTGGGSKDYLPIDGWRHKDGSVPDKDDITNSYAAAYSADPDPTNGDTAERDTFVYFGLDRRAVQGSANVGFWFLQDPAFEKNAQPATNINGTFDGEHVARSEDGPGDLLVLSEFDSGGQNPTIKVFEWVGSGGDEGGGALDTIFGGANGVAADCDSTADSVPVCVNVNTEPLPDSDIAWDYLGKQNPKRDMPTSAFFEGGINLDALFGETPCFSDFVAETRSSFEVNAVLKDLAASTFALCGAEVSIAPDDVNDVGDSHTFTVTATKTVAGHKTAAPLKAGDLVVTLTDAGGNAITPDSDQCATSDQTDGTCDVTFTSNTPGTITGHVEGDITIGDPDDPDAPTFAVSTGGDGENPDATKVFVDAKISISPDDVNGIGEPHTFTVTVQKDDGSSAGWAASTVGDVDVDLTSSDGAAHTLDADESTCDEDAADPNDFYDNLDENGQCTVVFTSQSAGKVTGHAAVDVKIISSEGEITITRSTDADTVEDSDNSADAVKQYADGTLRWLKVDGVGDALGGATFQVCQTHSYNSETDQFVVIDSDEGEEGDQPICVTVEDDGTEDDEDTPGEFQRNNQYLGRYTVVETEAPEGYSSEDRTETLEIVIDDPETTEVDESFAEPLDENGDPEPFVNLALYKIIVLTCNTTTEELVDSTAGLDTDANGTIADTERQETLYPDPADPEDPLHELCGAGGAVFDDLPGDVYDVEVEVPDAEPFFPELP